MSKQDRIEDYLHFKSVNNLHNSENTTRAYRNHLKQFEEFAEKEFAKDKSTRGLDVAVKYRSHAEKYRDHLVSQRDSIQVKTILHILTDYFSFLKIDPNPFEKLVKDYHVNQKEWQIKKIRRDELVLSEFEIEALIKQAEKETYHKTGNEYYLTHRNWLMVKMLAGYGMRIKALVSVDIGDISFMKRRIIVHSSKNKIPYPLPIISMIDDIRYHVASVRLSFVNDNRLKNEPLFFSKSGRRLSSTSARRAINKIAEKVDLYEPNRSTHQLRHFRATQYLREGMKIDLISQIMGVSVQVLRETYLHMTHGDTVREYEAWLNASRIEPVCPKCGYDQSTKELAKIQGIK